MADHFRAVGFAFSSLAEFEQFVAFVRHVLAELGQVPLAGSHGSLGVWGPDQGVKLYIHSDRQGSPIGLLPHFVGSSRIQLKVDEVFVDPRAPMDGYLRGMVVARDDASYPLVLAVPDADVAFPQIRPQGILTIQAAALAEQLKVFADDADFRAHAGELRSLATESCIPIGMFKPNGHPIDPPQPRAMFVGHVERAETRINSFSDLPFLYFTLKTIGGSFDVVADPAMVPNSIQPGNVVWGIFWLSADTCPDCTA